MELVASSPAGSAVPSTHAPVFVPFVEPLAPPLHFDFYVLAQSWQPAFCAGKSDQYPGCRQPLDYWRSHFTMHGLWPELATGKHPDFCGGAPFDAAVLDHALGRDVLVQYWPDVKFDTTSPQYSDFWKHEWTRHGTCSGLDEVAYFTTAVNLLRNGTATTPDLVQQNVNKSLSVDALRSAYPQAVVLKCVHGGVLSQVFSCWDKDAANTPTTRRACPPHILQEDTCTKSTIFIPAFP